MGEVTLDRLFGGDFSGEYLGATRWLDGGEAYTTLEAAENGEGTDLVRYQTRSGERSVLVAATALVPDGAQRPLRVQGYDWSADGRKLLIFTNSRRVWRQNTRGEIGRAHV